MSRLLDRLRKLDDLAKARQESEPGMDLSSLSVAELLEMRGVVEKEEIIGTKLTSEEMVHLTRLCEWCISRQGRRPLTRAEAMEAARRAEQAGEV